VIITLKKQESSALAKTTTRCAQYMGALCDPDPPTSQTDGRHAISIPRYALVLL